MDDQLTQEQAMSLLETKVRDLLGKYNQFSTENAKLRSLVGQLRRVLLDRDNDSRCSCCGDGSCQTCVRVRAVLAEAKELENGR